MRPGVTPWTPAQWAEIVHHARAERICDAALLRLALAHPRADIGLLLHWSLERDHHAGIVRGYAQATEGRHAALL